MQIRSQREQPCTSHQLCPLSRALQAGEPITAAFREVFFKEGAIQKSVMDCMKVCHLYLLTISLISSDLSGKIFLADFDNKRRSIEGQEELVNSDLEASTLQTNLWFKILAAL